MNSSDQNWVSIDIISYNFHHMKMIPRETLLLMTFQTTFWRRIAIPNAAEFKIFSFSDPYEWAWSVIESLPLVAIVTFDADLQSDHERWTMTTPLLSPHEQIPSISVLAATNEGFEWEKEIEKTNLQPHEMLLHKGSIYRTTCVGFKLKSPLKFILAHIL